MAKLGVGDILSGVGAGADILANRSNAKAQKEMARRQAQTIQLQNQNFLAAQPYFRQALQQAAGYAGLGDGVTQGQNGHFQLGAMPGQQNFGLGGNYGNREDQLRLQAAEEDIKRWQQQQLNQQRFQGGRMGLNEGAIGANLGRTIGQGNQQFAQFRRGLALNAGQEQERRMQNLQNLIAQGFGQGSQASAGYGQQAAMYGQQANAAAGDLGNIIQQFQYQRRLGQLQNPSPGPVDRGFTGPTSPAPWAQPGYQPNWWDQL